MSFVAVPLEMNGRFRLESTKRGHRVSERTPLKIKAVSFTSFSAPLPPKKCLEASEVRIESTKKRLRVSECPVLCCPSVLSCPVLQCSVMSSRPVLSCLVLLCRGLSRHVLCRDLLPSSVLRFFVLSCSVMSCPVLCCLALSRSTTSNSPRVHQRMCLAVSLREPSCFST